MEKILESLGLDRTPRLLVWNKVDRIPRLLERALLSQRGGVAVRALARRGFEELLMKAEDTLFSEGAAADAAALAQVTAGRAEGEA